MKNFKKKNYKSLLLVLILFQLLFVLVTNGLAEEERNAKPVISKAWEDFKNGRLDVIEPEKAVDLARKASMKYKQEWSKIGTSEIIPSEVALSFHWADKLKGQLNSDMIKRLEKKWVWGIHFEYKRLFSGSFYIFLDAKTGEQLDYFILK